MDGVATGGVIALAAFGLAAGVGITTIGPGGVLATAGLILLTSLGPAGVAGTAIATHVATGMVGSAAYYRSGQLRDHDLRSIALVMAAVAVIGTPLGVGLNGLLSRSAFGPLLAAAVAVAGALVWARRRSDTPARRRHDSPLLAAAVGFPVAVVSGVFGIGGPMLSVPLLVIVGTRVLDALAAAQLQSIVIAGTGTVVYVIQGSIRWPLAAVVGIPELVGVLAGHRIAHAVDERWLTGALVVALVALAPWLVLRG